MCSLCCYCCCCCCRCCLLLAGTSAVVVAVDFIGFAVVGVYCCRCCRRCLCCMFSRCVAAMIDLAPLPSPCGHEVRLGADSRLTPPWQRLHISYISLLQHTWTRLSLLPCRRYIPSPLDPYNILVPTCHAGHDRVDAVEGDAHVMRRSPFLAALRERYVGVAVATPLQPKPRRSAYPDFYQ